MAGPLFQKLNPYRVFGTISVSSVLKDMVWVLGFFIIFILVLAVAHVETWIIVFSFVLLTGLLIFFAHCFRWLMLNDRNSLKSENYQLEDKRMELMGVKGDEKPARIIEGQIDTKRPKLIAGRRKR